MAFDLKKSFNSLKDRLKKEVKKEEKVLRKSPKLVYIIIGGLVGVVVVFLVVMSVGIYKYGWEDNFTSGVTKVLPFPAATVNGKVVYYHDYLENVSILEKYQKEFKGVKSFTTDDGKKVLASIKKDTYNRLIEDALVKTEATNLNVTVTDKELNDSFNDLIKSNGGKDAFAGVLTKYYGLSLNDFRDEVYKPRLLRQKVSEKFSSDETVNADAKKKAQEVLDKVKAGGDFATLAKQYSQDTTAANGGDLGLFGKGKMVPEFEKAAFSLKAGEVSGLVKTVYGYHIIKVTAVKGDQIQASHILIKTKDFAQWLDDAKQSAKIWPNSVVDIVAYKK